MPYSNHDARDKDRAKLFEIIDRLSFKRGDFVLASGQKSKYYIDCRLTTLSAEGSLLIGRLFYDRIADLHADAVGGMSMGADPMVSAVTVQSALEGRGLDGFLIRKEAKGHGTGRQIEGHIAPWMKVVLLEDVVTSGGSTVAAVNAVRLLSPQIKIVQILSIVDREAGGADAFSALGIPYQSLFRVSDFLQN